MFITPELLQQLLRKQKEKTITAREMVLLRLYLSTPEAEDVLSAIDFSDMPEAAGQPATSPETRYQQILRKIEPQHRLPWRRWTAVAAAAVLLISSGVWLFRDTDNGNQASRAAASMLTAYTGNGELKAIMLPDSSRVWLNARSVISYPATFTGKERKVFLQQGEAFFQVTHNTQQPFIVQNTDSIQTTVLGTSFTVTTDSLAPNMQVAVKTGKVRVGRNLATIATLLPGDQVNYNSSNHYTHLSQVSPEAIGGWTTGEIKLLQADFTTMASLIQKLYGIRVEAGNATVSRNLYSLPVKYGTDPRKLLEVICVINGNHAEFKKADSTRIIIH